MQLVLQSRLDDSLEDESNDVVAGVGVVAAAVA